MFTNAQNQAMAVVKHLSDGDIDMTIADLVAKAPKSVLVNVKTRLVMSNKK